MLQNVARNLIGPPGGPARWVGAVGGGRTGGRMQPDSAAVGPVRDETGSYCWEFIRPGTTGQVIPRNFPQAAGLRFLS